MFKHGLMHWLSCLFDGESRLDGKFSRHAERLVSAELTLHGILLRLSSLFLPLLRHLAQVGVVFVLILQPLQF